MDDECLCMTNRRHATVKPSRGERARQSHDRHLLLCLLSTAHIPTHRPSAAMTTTDMDRAAKLFFSSPRFAVAGASSDPRKFGHKSEYRFTLPSPPPSHHQAHRILRLRPSSTSLHHLLLLFYTPPPRRKDPALSPRYEDQASLLTTTLTPVSIRMVHSTQPAGDPTQPWEQPDQRQRHRACHQAVAVCARAPYRDEPVGHHPARRDGQVAHRGQEGRYQGRVVATWHV